MRERRNGAADGRGRYSVRIYQETPETRWFQRYVLRRRWRRYLAHAGQLDSFTVEQDLNQTANAVFAVADPSRRALEPCPMVMSKGGSLVDCPGLTATGECGQGKGSDPCACGHPVCQHTMFSKYGFPCKVSGCECRDYTAAEEVGG